MTLPPHPALIALQFLTTIPVILKKLPSDQDMGRSLLYYPLVGLLIGVLLTAFAAGLSHISSPTSAPLVAALTLTFWVFLTGGLHLDGLADSVDALMGGFGDRQKTLEIMKDPASGPMGVISLVLVLLVKFTALWLTFRAQNCLGVLIAPLLGRTALITLFSTTPYVRKGGLGTLISEHMPKQTSLIVMVVALCITAAITGTSAVWILLTCAGTFIALRALFISRLGGTTGDSAGALVELIEMTVLVVTVFATS
ncbi:MAG: adenosylcobinamide-GDP ribazoletransferase [bacterium]|nr:adenosylcobinamide-GDP ribazoletransferase [bacterium]